MKFLCINELENEVSRHETVDEAIEEAKDWMAGYADEDGFPQEIMDGGIKVATLLYETSFDEQHDKDGVVYGELVLAEADDELITEESETDKKQITLSIDKITEMGTLYQKAIYPQGAHPIQIKETFQAYVAGMYEGLQVFKQMPPEVLQQTEKELREWFKERYKDLVSGKI